MFLHIQLFFDMSAFLRIYSGLGFVFVKFVRSRFLSIDCILLTELKQHEIFEHLYVY